MTRLRTGHHADRQGSGDDRAASSGSRRGVRVRLIAQNLKRQKELEKVLQDIPGLKHLQAQVAASEDEILSALTAERQGGKDRNLVVLDTSLPFAQLQALVKRYKKLHTNHLVVIISSRLAPWEEAEVVSAGARAFVPDSFRRDALIAVLALVLAGQRFRPYGKRAGGTVAPPNGENGDENGPGTSEFGDGLPARPLTPAEVRVCNVLVSGMPHKLMADELGVTVGVVNIHLGRIKEKFGIPSLAQLRTVLQRLQDMDLTAFERALRGEPVNLDWLFDLMTVEHMRKGTVIFRKGDAADKLYLIVKGQVGLPEIGKTMGPGIYFGEVGIFTPEQVRTHTAVCETDVELRSLELAQVRRFYQLKPVFATQMLVLITQRLRDDIKRLEGKGP